jgi:hypothetical protein
MLGSQIRSDWSSRFYQSDQIKEFNLTDLIEINLMTSVVGANNSSLSC